MPAIEGMYKKILGATSELSEHFAANAEKGVERNPAGEITKPGMNIFDNAAMSYHETMLGKNSSLARKSMGYGVPGVIGAGMGIGAYNEGQNGNTGAATILGAGAAVMGGALALSHFGGVAEKEVGAKVAAGLSKGLQPEKTPVADLLNHSKGQAENVIKGAASAASPVMNDLKDRAGNMFDSAKSAMGGVATAVKEGFGEDLKNAQRVGGSIKDAVSDRFADAKIAFTDRLDRHLENVTGQTSPNLANRRKAELELRDAGL